MHKAIRILVIPCIILNIVVVVHLVALFFWNIDILNINREEPNSKSLVLDYPPSGSTGPMQVFDENFTMHGVSLTVNVFLGYSGILAEGTPVDFAALGSLYPDGQQIIDRVNVGFDGSTYYKALSNTPAQFSPQLKEGNVYTLYVDAPILGTISWNTQGDFYPFIVLNFKNGSAPITINYQDPNFRVHVSGIDVILQEQSNRKSLAITTDGIILSIIDFPFIVGFILKRNQGENKNNQSIKTKTKQKQTYSKAPRKKRKHKKRKKKRPEKTE